MQKPTRHVLVHGAVGGLLAGLVVAVWFLVTDLVAGQAFLTPTVLAGAVLEREILEPTFRIVATYTLLHFGVFVALGVAAAAFFAVTGVAPGLLMGFVFGIGVLDGIHYGALLAIGSTVLTVLPVPHVLAANVAAGLVLMTYLHRAVRSESPLGLRVLEGHPLLLQGLGVGLLGAAAVAFWFFLLDTLTRYPFYTPAALGSAVLLGATSPAEVQMNVGIIVAYTVLHLAAFGITGIAFVWVAARIESAPGLWLMVLMGFIVLEALFVATMGLIGGWVLGAVGWWAVVVGNLVAVAAMGRVLWQVRPGLREALAVGAAETRV